MPWCFNRLPPIPSAPRVLRCPFRRPFIPNILAQIPLNFIVVNYLEYSTRFFFQKWMKFFTTEKNSTYKSRNNFCSSPKHIWVLRVWWAGFHCKYRIWLDKKRMIDIFAGSRKPYLAEIAWFRSAGFLSKIQFPMIRSSGLVQTLFNRTGIIRYFCLFFCNFFI